MQTSRDEIHDCLVATYQSLEASVLNRALLENGIQAADLRKAIITSFLFEQGVILDQFWFEEQGRKWYPGVFFATEPHDEFERTTLHLPSERIGMNFHEYAHGAADWALENEANPGAIRIGNNCDLEADQ